MIEDKSSAAILDRLEACRARTNQPTISITEHDAILDRLAIAHAVDREIRSECDTVLLDAMAEIRYLYDALDAWAAGNRHQAAESKLAEDLGTEEMKNDTANILDQVIIALRRSNTQFWDCDCLSEDRVVCNCCPGKLSEDNYNLLVEVHREIKSLRAERDQLHSDVGQDARADRDRVDSHELHVTLGLYMNAFETRVKVLEESYEDLDDRCSVLEEEIA